MHLSNGRLVKKSGVPLLFPDTQAQIVAWYNFSRKHEVLKAKTPAMTSGLTNHVWAIKELIERPGEA